jgi:general secretion pathway protein D
MPEGEALPGEAPADEATEEAPEEAEEEMPPAPVPGEPLRLNFRDAAVQAVLEYLSEATGLVILQEAPIDGRITVISRQPIDTDEAVALLDTVLKEKGYAAVRTGRNLKIVPLERAARENLPVFSGNDPDEIPVADRLVTHVIPVRYADATRLRQDLAPLIPETATLSSNQASNALVLVDTQANIRRVVQIIRAMDAHMAGEAEVKVFQLEYADASNTATLISTLFQEEEQEGDARRRFPFPFGRGRDRGRDRDDEEGGRQQKVIAAADTRTNTLVVSASPDVMPVIESIVEELDANPSEEDSYFIYPLKNADATNIADVLNNIFWGTGTTTGTAGAARGGTVQAGRTASRFGGRTTSGAQVAASANDLVGQVFCVADEDTNSIIVRTATKHFERVREMLEELDRAIRQVLIKVLLAEVTHEDELDLGTEFSVLNLQYGADLEVTGTLGSPDEDAGGLVTATMTANLAQTFNALQREGRMDVLSRPYILTSDNQEATITVGQEVPFIRNSRLTEEGQTINTIEYEDVGIILTVTPHINPQGLVIMDVEPEISSITDTTVPISETVNATVYAKRSAATQVAIHNGQTIVIGGLMEDRIVDSVRKVPILGDIPLLGELFKSTTKDTTKTELLIFLTPHVAEEPDQLTAMSEDETSNIQAVKEAGGSGAFEQHVESMKRGATPKTAPDDKAESHGVIAIPTEPEPETQGDVDGAQP